MPPSITLYCAALPDGTTLGELSPAPEAARRTGQAELDRARAADADLEPGALFLVTLTITPASPGAVVAALGLTPDEESLSYAAMLLQQHGEGR